MTLLTFKTGHPNSFRRQEKSVSEAKIGFLFAQYQTTGAADNGKEKGRERRG